MTATPSLSLFLPQDLFAPFFADTHPRAPAPPTAGDSRPTDAVPCVFRALTPHAGARVAAPARAPF